MSQPKTAQPQWIGDTSPRLKVLADRGIGHTALDLSTGVEFTTMKHELPCGRYFQFDEEDAPLIAAYSWHVVNGYVQTEIGSRKNGTRRTMRLHRLILQPQDNEIVDHINRDPLDNRRANLRIADRSKNGMNRTAQANNKSGFKGVCKKYKRGKWTGNWQANITVRGKSYNLGTTFPTPELAHAAYVKAAEQLHGEFACA